MTWFYMVSHPIMTSNIFGKSPRPSNQGVLEARDDHSERKQHLSAYYGYGEIEHRSGTFFGKESPVGPRRKHYD